MWEAVEAGDIQNKTLKKYKHYIFKKSLNMFCNSVILCFVPHQKGKKNKKIINKCTIHLRFDLLYLWSVFFNTCGLVLLVLVWSLSVCVCVHTLCIHVRLLHHPSSVVELYFYNSAAKCSVSSHFLTNSRLSVQPRHETPLSRRICFKCLTRIFL